MQALVLQGQAGRGHCSVAPPPRCLAGTWLSDDAVYRARSRCSCNKAVDIHNFLGLPVQAGIGGRHHVAQVCHRGVGPGGGAWRHVVTSGCKDRWEGRCSLQPRCVSACVRTMLCSVNIPQLSYNCTHILAAEHLRFTGLPYSRSLRCTDATHA